MRRNYLRAVLVMLVLAGTGQAQNKIEITVEGGKYDLKNVSICVPLSLAKSSANLPEAELDVKGGKLKLIGQLTSPGIATESITPSSDGTVRRDLHFLVPHLDAGAKLIVTCTLREARAFAPGFQWRHQEDRPTTLEFADAKSARPILRYMNATYDNSTPQARNRTYKVFHHLYDPQGKRLVTNGGHTDPYEDEKKLKATSYIYETFFRILAERATAGMQRRIIVNLTQSAEERYNHFVEKYPVMASRLPQYVIASYLGMTTEFLSKIRNRKVRRKS